MVQIASNLLGAYDQGLLQGQTERRAQTLGRLTPQIGTAKTPQQRQALVQGFSEGGAPDQALGLYKIFAEADAQEFGRAKNRLDLFGRIAADPNDPTKPVSDPAAYAARLNAARAQGLDVTGAPEAIEDLHASWPMFQDAYKAADFAAKRRAGELENQKTQSEIALRGAQAATERAQARRFGAMADNGGNPRAPTGYMYSADGSSLIAIPGGPADPATKGFNEMQSKANIFAQRAVEAERQIGQFGDALTSPLQQMGGAIPGVGNYLTSKEFQMADQAKRNMVNAFLRRESGAAISAQEFANADAQYFPQPGDTPEVIRQKAQNRATQIRAIAQEAGPAYRGEAVESAQPQMRGGAGGLAFQTESQAELNTAVQGLIARGGKVTQGQDGSQIVVMPDGRRFQIEGVQ